MEKGRFWARNEKEMCPGGATCLPMLGNVLAPLGQAAYPKMDKTRLKTTVSGEEWQVSEAGTRRQYGMTISSGQQDQVGNKIKWATKSKNRRNRCIIMYRRPRKNREDTNTVTKRFRKPTFKC